MSNLSLANVLLLAADEHSSTVDRTSLRSAGARHIRFMSSGAEALTLLNNICAGGQTAEGIDLIVCNEQLADTDVLDFLNKMTSLPERLRPPVLALHSSESGRLSWQASLQAGAAASLCRPYTLATLAGAVQRAGQSSPRIGVPAVSPLRRNFAGPARPVLPQIKERASAAAKAPDSSATQKTVDLKVAAKTSALNPIRREAPAQPVPTALITAPKTPQSAADFLARGLALLRENRPAQAAEALHDTLRLEPLNAEACLAMARVFRSWQDQTAVLKWLQRAAAAYVCIGQKERAKTIQDKLPQEMRRGGHVMLEASICLLENGLYQQAANIFMDMPEELDAPLHLLVSRACQFTANPDYALERICDAMRQAGHTSTARNLRHRLLPGEQPQTERKPSGFCANFPFLYTILAVAGHTARTWRQASA